jgi:hypothetical protein
MMRDAELEVPFERPPVAPDLGEGILVTFGYREGAGYLARVHDGWTRETTERASLVNYGTALTQARKAWAATRKTIGQPIVTEA